MNPIIETSPELKLSVKQIENLQTELEQYTALYRPMFSRREQKEHYETYLKGLMLTLPNKSVETMILNLKGDDPNEIRNLQHFMSEGRWADQTILRQHWQEVSDDLGEAEGVLIGDDSGVPKQGQESVGVKRQWCGQLGKRANCQVGVFLGYASQHGHTLLDHRLYLPREWVEDQAYAERRQKCGVPDNIRFQTKPALLLEMVKAVHTAGTLPFRWFTCDEAYGRDTAFLDQVGNYVWYLAEVDQDTRVWLTRPQTAVPDGSGRGRKPTREQLCPGEPQAQEVAAIAAALPAKQWCRQTIKEGSKGTLVADFAALRVVAVRDGLPGPAVWLVFRRNPATGELKCYLSNAPTETALSTFAWLSGMRWPIETCFENGKQEVGFGDYQLRSWVGWHHHMTLCTLAHFFLVRLQIRLKDEAPKLTLPQAILLLKAALAQPQPDAAKAIEIVNYYQRRHHAAYLSHRKRRLSQINSSEVSW
jgi:SRSO17 transposase